MKNFFYKFCFSSDNANILLPPDGILSHDISLKKYVYIFTFVYDHKRSIYIETFLFTCKNNINKYKNPQLSPCWSGWLKNAHRGTEWHCTGRDLTLVTVRTCYLAGMNGLEKIYVWTEILRFSEISIFKVFEYYCSELYCRMLYRCRFHSPLWLIVIVMHISSKSWFQNCSILNSFFSCIQRELNNVQCLLTDTDQGHALSTMETTL